MNGWSANDVAISGIQVGASATKQVVSKEYAITAGGSLHHVVKIKVSSGTFNTGIIAYFQHAIGGDWVDAKSVALTADGNYYLKFNIEVAGDQAYLPLLNKGRIVISTGAGDAVTVDSIDILQEL